MNISDILFHPVVQILGWTLVHFIWQGVVIAIITAGLIAALRRHSANVRYIIACSAMVMMLILPVATFLVLRSSTSAPGANRTSQAQAQVRPDQSATAAAAAAQSSELAWRSALLKSVSPMLPWLVSLWLVGVLALSLRLVGGWRYAQQLKRVGARPVSSHYQEVFAATIQRLRISRPITLLESTLVQVPTAIGWLRPAILLPASALTGLSTEQLTAIVVHELAHIRRHDYLINLMQTMVETLLFYHPAVWWVSKQIRAERENCCDDIAVAVCGDVLTYARALTELEQMRGAQPQLALAATGGSLLGRIRRLVQEPSRGPNHVGLWLAGVVVLMTVVAAGAGLRSSFSSTYEVPQYAQGSAEQQAAEAMDLLLRSLKGRNFEMKGDVIAALDRIRRSGTIDPLIHALRDGDESTREKVAWAMGNLGDKRAVDHLAAALSNGNWRGQHTVCWALGMIGDPRAVEPLIETLKNGNEDARHGAAWALGRIGDRAAVEPLIALLKDKAADVRHGAAWALGMIGDSRAIEPLREALNDPDSDVRGAVNQALMKLGAR